MELTLYGRPNPRQAEFFASTAAHTAYGGARGGGKSWAMRRKLVLLCLGYKGLNCLLLRRTLPELRENHVIPLLKELGDAAAYNATERVFRFPNGSRLLRRGERRISVSGSGIRRYRHGGGHAFYRRSDALFDHMQPHHAKGF